MTVEKHIHLDTSYLFPLIIDRTSTIAGIPSIARREISKRAEMIRKKFYNLRPAANIKIIVSQLTIGELLSVSLRELGNYTSSRQISYSQIAHALTLVLEKDLGINESLTDLKPLDYKAVKIARRLAENDYIFETNFTDTLIISQALSDELADELYIMESKLIKSPVLHDLQEQLINEGVRKSKLSFITE